MTIAVTAADILRVQTVINHSCLPKYAFLVVKNYVYRFDARPRSFFLRSAAKIAVAVSSLLGLLQSIIGNPPNSLLKVTESSLEEAGCASSWGYSAYLEDIRTKYPDKVSVKIRKPGLACLLKRSATRLGHASKLVAVGRSAAVARKTGMAAAVVWVFRLFVPWVIYVAADPSIVKIDLTLL